MKVSKRVHPPLACGENSVVYFQMLYDHQSSMWEKEYCRSNQGHHQCQVTLLCLASSGDLEEIASTDDFRRAWYNESWEPC